MATTAMCTSFKQELLQALHCFNGVVTSATGTTHTTFVLDGLSSTAGVASGMSVTGTNIPANTMVASVTSNVAVLLSAAATGTGTTGGYTFTGDIFKILLIKVTPTTTFSGTQTNVGTPSTGASSVTNVGTDEVTNAAGTSYVAGGVALVNVTPSVPANPGTTAITNFSPNPQWTSATFSTTAAIIYNSYTGGTLARGGAGATPIVGRTVSVHDFGGPQQVTNGAFTVVMPPSAGTIDGTNAILRIA